jgi:ELWxxDGT repeat protein
MPGDNQLSGAIRVGLPINRRDKVGRKDLEDLYQFSTAGRSSFNLNLSKISKKAKVGVELYKLTRPLNEVTGLVGNIDFSKISASARSSFQLVSTSRGLSTRAARIDLSAIDAGDYVVRVRAVNKRDSKYRLSLVGALLPEDPIPTPTPEPVPTPEPTPTPNPTAAGNSLETALPVNLPLTQPGIVNDGDTQDYYSFSLSSAGDYKVDLFGLGADANVEILDSNGGILKAATTAGVQDESMIVPLDVGNYYAHVVQGGAGSSTNYTLGMTLLTDNYAGTYAAGKPSASNLVLTDTPQVFSNYVVDGGKNSPEDLIKFDVTQRSFLKLELKGLLGENLDGNLDVQLLSDADFATPELGLTSAKLGKSAEVFGGTLAVGTYYIRIMPGGTAGSGEGSAYNLSLSLKPKNDVPTITRDIRFGAEGSSAAFLTEANGLSYFSAVDESDTALWVSDGTLDGTRKLKSFQSGSLSNFTEVSGFLYFMGDQNGSTGTELWRTNGTTTGTVLVKDIRAGTFGSNPSQLTAVGDRLYFTAIPNAVVTDIRFYRTNTEGTDIQEVTGVGNISGLAAFGNTLYFAGEASGGGENELWRIVDGTAATVTPVTTDLNPSGSSAPGGFIVAPNGKLYAAADNGSNPFGSAVSLVKINTSGSPTATVVQTGLENPTDFVTVGSDIYFSAFTPANGTELWKLNTSTDTASLLNIAADSSGITSSNPTNLVAVGNSVYFFANDGSGKGLWTTNGTTTTRVNITDAAAGAMGDNPTELVAINNMLYFAATDATKGKELWSYNTATSAMKINDINTSGSSDPGRLTNIGGILFFIANNGQDGLEVMSL